MVKWGRFAFGTRLQNIQWIKLYKCAKFHACRKMCTIFVLRDWTIVVELTEGILLYISVTKGGTTLVFLCKIDKDVLFKDMRGATLAPLGNLKYSPLK